MTVLWCSRVCEKFVKYYDLGRVIQIIIFHLRAGQDICCWLKVVSIKGNIADGKCKKKLVHSELISSEINIFFLNVTKK